MSEQNLPKRDTTFKQEHGAVTHAVKRSPERAVARAIKGSSKLLEENQTKQALNVLTLAKPVLAGQSSEQSADYYQMLGTIHEALGNVSAAERAFARAREA
ncbi:hypothetical protein [Rothia aerolata]|uniref:Tetratricopeptide repeat protein n=1 Tax=Rothia aerolata TaxID=1812262 RepID=A0A917IM82_9MICC|nr:hypothetical protein [Rothia aerolata]GGH56885.1 hypothetical protein GCM10007359_01450 [Rothia aerolata]